MLARTVGPRLALVFTLVSLAAAARAQEASGFVDRRDLAGHHFLVSHLVEDPFSVTSFGMNTAFGTGQALGPKFDLSTNPPTPLNESRWYSYASLGEQFDLTVRVLEYLSLHGGIVAGVRQGAGNGSALVVGTNVQVTGTLGVKGSYAILDNLRVSLSTEGLFGPQMNVLVYQALQQAKASGSWNNADLFDSRKAVTANVTTAAAWAPLAWLGVIGNVRYIHTKSVTIDDASQDGVAGALSAEFDALPLVNWLPLGVEVGYRRTGSLAGGGTATQDDYGGGVYYTGRRNLALGVEAIHRKGRLETELRSNQTLAWVNFRYFW